MQKSNRFFFILTFIYSGIILSLGSWWIYTVINLQHYLPSEKSAKVVNMMKWEGLTFFSILLLMTFSLLALYLKDQRKTKSLQSFFATMTHELKTPLASIRLQSEVISDLMDNVENEKILNLHNRLIQDTKKLETQMDKILQLSRIEGGGNLNLVSVEISDFIKNAAKNWAPNLNVKIQSSSNPVIKVDEFAINLIFRNLFENSINHASAKNINISIKENDQSVIISYSDEGQFNGDLEKLGKLFFKHKSSKGTGIGLYLIKKLTEAMKGEVQFFNQNTLVIKLIFPRLIV